MFRVRIESILYDESRDVLCARVGEKLRKREGSKPVRFQAMDCEDKACFMCSSESSSTSVEPLDSRSLDGVERPTVVFGCDTKCLRGAQHVRRSNTLLRYVALHG